MTFPETPEQQPSEQSAESPEASSEGMHDPFAAMLNEFSGEAQAETIDGSDEEHPTRQRRRKPRSKPGIGFIIVVMLVVIAILAGLLFIPGSPFAGILSLGGGGDVKVYLQAPPLVPTGENFTMTLTVVNESQDYFQVEEIRLPQSLLDAAVVVKVFPGNLSQNNYGLQTGFDIGILLAPGDQREFEFTLQSMKEADIYGEIEVADEVAGKTNVRTGFRVVIGQMLAVQASATHSPTPTFTLTPTPTLSPTPLPTLKPELPYKALVVVTAKARYAGQLRPFVVGSGSIISPDGLVLTNAHITAFNEFVEVESYTISMVDSPESSAEERYYAEVVAADKDADVAVLRITADIRKRTVNPAELNLPFVALGNSDDLELGDPIIVLGFPIIGGTTVTWEGGFVGGFTTTRKFGSRSWIKTTAMIVAGSSGGMVLDNQMRLVGIPTRLGDGGPGEEVIDCRVIADSDSDGDVTPRDPCVSVGGFINAFRPLAIGMPIIEQALEKTGAQLVLPTVQVAGTALPPAATAEPTATNTPLLPWSVQFEDDFSSPGSGWSNSSKAEGSAGYKEGAYQVAVQAASQLIWGSLGTTFSDLLVTVKARVETSATDGQFGVICRYQDADNFYAFAISEQGYYAIFTMNQGQVEILQNWTASSLIPKEGWVNLAVRCAGDQLSLLVNGTLLAQVSDSRLREGQVGLFAGTMETTGLVVNFDDLEIQAP